MYTLQAGAGDVISGTATVTGVDEIGAIRFHAVNGQKLYEYRFSLSPSGNLQIGFLAPRAGIYEIHVTAGAPTSYVLRTNRRTPAERMASVPVTRPVEESPRMTRLIREVASGQPGTVERFWTEVQARGVPLVEPIEGDARDVLVTFLWRQMFETHNVLVHWSMCCVEDSYMTRIPSTDVWFKTMRLARDSRFSYQLGPNYLPSDWYTLQRDPLNPKTVYEESSLLDLPDAPDERWFRETPSARGVLTDHRLYSKVLGKSRDVVVYTPPGYSPARGPYPLLVLFDGTTYLDAATGMGALNTIDNLVGARRMRPTVVCFVSDNRPMPDEKTYADAMALELLPWIRATYAVSSRATDVVIGGYSGGGAAAGRVAFQYPGAFGNVLLQSGGQQPLVNVVLDSPKLPIRFYIDMGRYDQARRWSEMTALQKAVDGWFDDEPAPSGANRLQRMRLLTTVLQAKGYDFTYREHGGTHESVLWRATLAEALTTLLPENTP